MVNNFNFNLTRGSLGVTFIFLSFVTQAVQLQRAWLLCSESFHSVPLCGKYYVGQLAMR